MTVQGRVICLQECLLSIGFKREIDQCEKENLKNKQNDIQYRKQR